MASVLCSRNVPWRLWRSTWRSTTWSKYTYHAKSTRFKYIFRRKYVHHDETSLNNVRGKKIEFIMSRNYLDIKKLRKSIFKKSDTDTYKD